ncbi:MAG TPA: hypothetical protein PLR85_17135, partial [Nitrospira sp.]|nr:hypothetical protein [Nitrospira sp.]
GMLPPQTELVGYLVTGKTLCRGERLLQTFADGLTQWRAQIGIAEQGSQPVIDEAFDQALQFGKA